MRFHDFRVIVIFLIFFYKPAISLPVPVEAHVPGWGVVQCAVRALFPGVLTDHLHEEQLGRVCIVLHEPCRVLKWALIVHSSARLAAGLVT